MPGTTHPTGRTDGGFDPDRVETVTFDSYGTVVDVAAAETALAAVVDDPAAVSRAWRNRSLMYTFVADALDAYEPFSAVLRDALEGALSANGVDLAPEERESVLGAYDDLAVFADVRPGMERLRAAGYDLWVVSNGDPEMLAAMVESADVEDLVAGTVSADEVRRFKPGADLYRHAAARTGTPVDRIAHVAAGWFDILGAANAGMQAVWVDREGAAFEPFGPDPHLTVGSFEALADELTDAGG